jgi:hypothetical protein
MAVGVKAAAFAAFARVFVAALSGVAPSWSALLAILAALTMTVGNVTAVLQRSVKRMLAYSSIAHAGYALLGLVVATRDGGAALCFYLAVYTFMTLGAFAVVIALGRRGEPNEDLADWAGVGFRHPVLGFSMAVFMLSLAGVPPTAGVRGEVLPLQRGDRRRLDVARRDRRAERGRVRVLLPRRARRDVHGGGHARDRAALVATVPAGDDPRHGRRDDRHRRAPAQPMRLAERAFVSLR